MPDSHSVMMSKRIIHLVGEDDSSKDLRIVQIGKFCDKHGFSAIFRHVKLQKFLYQLVEGI
jgi:hypothetical protein